MANPSPDLLRCPFCGGACDPEGWVGSGIGGTPVCGPECEECGACTDTVEDWNRRATPPSPSTAPEHSRIANCEYPAAKHNGSLTIEVDERAAFEVLFATIHPSARLPEASLFERVVSDSRYCSLEVEYAWFTYRAALASRPADVSLRPDCERESEESLKRDRPAEVDEATVRREFRQVAETGNHSALVDWLVARGMGVRPLEVDDEGLPPLPHTTYNGYSDGSEPLYTAEQYRQGQRDAVAADRARRGGQP